jgi:hypothetical protein
MTDTITWSGKTSSFHHKWNDTPNSPDEKEGLRKVWFLDAQWSTCPIEVENSVKQLWSYNELGNDKYMLKRSVDDLIELRYSLGGKPPEYPGYLTRGEVINVDPLIQYIREHGIPDDEEVVIHWWW